MFSFHLFKRQANRRGIFLLTCFCINALALLIPTVIEVINASSSWWWMGNFVIALMIILSIVTPVVSLFKPGFSYKGHPGMRHSTLVASSAIIISTCSIILSMNIIKDTGFLSWKQVILYGLVIPLHGMHSLTIYGSLFKGPTSKFGKLYQPYLPIIE